MPFETNLSGNSGGFSYRCILIIRCFYVSFLMFFPFGLGPLSTSTPAKEVGHPPRNVSPSSLSVVDISR